MSQIQIDAELCERLREKAREECRTMTNMVNVLLRLSLGMEAAKPEPPEPAALDKPDQP